MQKKDDRIRCIVCNQWREQGIEILDEFICESCEKEIVKTDVEDQKYPYFVTRLKHLWTGGENRAERGL
ncbi:inhibitor of sigma-G Gin protein [Melghirimyces profundicolus]|uniref:Inhibitor of sigma-G Gin protein n=1 Tax=Melghirimyces profundicolus TaxID=1242148 RepID=A0A2T6BGM4_9BACL|nr:sigma factor G inhibitor Gin [Melghirimyces profundicolus]PTX55209.1 inhibitor of sigma-G Gin protein [Melghirimyces profundicolus]